MTVPIGTPIFSDTYVRGPNLTPAIEAMSVLCLHRGRSQAQSSGLASCFVYLYPERIPLQQLGCDKVVPAPRRWVLRLDGLDIGMAIASQVSDSLGSRSNPSARAHPLVRASFSRVAMFTGASFVRSHHPMQPQSGPTARCKASASKARFLNPPRQREAPPCRCYS